MSSNPGPGTLRPGGRLGVLRSWLQSGPTQAWDSSDALPVEIVGPRAPSRRPVCVLVADDNPVNLMLISALLESRGLAPLLAADGGEAVALACELRVDLILMDLQMPVLDGLDATSAIRRFERASSRPAVPVLAYSCALPGEGVLARHGLNGALNKPCDEQELEDCLVRWCPSYRSARPVQAVAQLHASRRAATRTDGPGRAALD